MAVYGQVSAVSRLASFVLVVLLDLSIQQLLILLRCVHDGCRRWLRSTSRCSKHHLVVVGQGGRMVQLRALIGTVAPLVDESNALITHHTSIALSRQRGGLLPVPQLPPRQLHDHALVVDDHLALTAQLSLVKFGVTQGLFTSFIVHLLDLLEALVS